MKKIVTLWLLGMILVLLSPQILIAADSAEQNYQEARKYYLGIQVQMDKKKALFYFNKAARSEHARAENSLGIMYEFGEGVPADQEQAVEWYQKSAKHGYWGGRLNLARKQLSGQGIRQDLQTAMHEIKQLAEHGNPNAQILLTAIYSSALPDFGVEKNDEEAFKWTVMAAEQGFDKAEGLLGHFYRLGLGVEKDERLSRFWLENASTGDAEAQYEVATLLASESHDNAEQDAESVKWLQKAAEQGHAAAQYALGRAYMKGIGVTQSHRHGLKWLMLSARQHNHYAENYLGIAFRKGLGVVQDPGQAIRWYTRAAEEGNLRAAQFNLGRMYETGYGVPKDEELALHWYTKAADQGHRESMQILAQRGAITNYHSSLYEAALAS